MSDMDYRMDGMPEEMEKTEEIPDLLQIYLDEVQAVRELLPEEEAAAVQAARNGDPAARDRLTEGYLKHALSLIRDYMGGPLPVSEMIGISNLAVVKAVRTYLGALQTETLHDMITRIVKEDLSAAAARESSQSETNRGIAARANRLTEVSRVMANELGRPATEAELAERMKMTESEIRTLIDMTMRAI